MEVAPRETGDVREVEVAGMAPPEEVAGMAPPVEVAGMAPPVEVAGMAPPVEVAGMAPPVEVAGMAPPEETMRMPGSEEMADVEHSAADCEPGQAGGHGAGWIWGDPADGIPADAPLHTLLLAASRVMGAFYAGTLVQAGLRISPAGLGVLRVLLAGDGLKSSDVAARGWSSPGTLTSVVNTLVREGYVERRPDPADRRVVRLYVTDKGRRICEEYLTIAGPRWRAAFDFVSPADEPVVRKFFVDIISQFSELTRKERGR